MTQASVGGHLDGKYPPLAGVDISGQDCSFAPFRIIPYIHILPKSVD
ncbi:MAG: hypothetical protein R3350_05415 [Saprospiraceae bacterium]|nr:hypothetical protein [Saprospiraceae bacterium]